MSKYLAIDLGASSYRFILSDDHLNLTVRSRYKNHLVEVEGVKYWDIDTIYHTIVKELKELSNEGIKIKSMAINTWGCDFMKLDRSSSPKYAYSYMQGLDIEEKQQVNSLLTDNELYSLTAIAPQDFNTIYRLGNIKHDIVFISSELQYRLTGGMYVDYTIASTSQLLDKERNVFNEKIVSSLNLEGRLPQLIEPLSLRKKLKVPGFTNIDLVFIGNHDTACAFYTAEKNSCLVNLGSWTIIGLGTQSVKYFDRNYSYERGVKTKYKIVKNIYGMNVFNQLIKELAITEDYSSLQLSLRKNNHDLLIDFKDFTLGQSVTSYIHARCVENLNNYQLLNVYLNSLAKTIASEVKDIKKLTNEQINSLYIIGGGSQNQLLVEKIKNNVKLEVKIGSAEATALGNIMMQKESENGSSTN